MNLPDVFKKLPYQDDIVLRARQILRKIMAEDNWDTELHRDNATASDYLLPDGDVSPGTVSRWTRMTVQGPCTHTTYDLIDDAVGAPDDDTTYAEHCDEDGGNPQFSSFTLANPDDVILVAGAVITKITVHYRIRGFASGEGMHPGITTYTVDYLGTANQPGDTGGSYVDGSHDWTTNPNTGNAWTKTELDDLKLRMGFLKTGAPAAASDVRCTQAYVEVVFVNQVTTITQPSGRVRFERFTAGSADHKIGNKFTSEDWSDYTHLRFKIEKVTYAGAVALKVGIYGTTLYSVDVGDYCRFDDKTTELLCVIPLADFVALGADITDIEGVAFTADGDNGDYDFYIDDLVGVALTDEGNDEYEAPIDKTIKGFADVGTGVQVPAEMGEVTERGATFYIPKDTIIDKDDRIVYNSEVYIVTGINDSYDTHLLVEAVLLEVWDESNLP